VRLTYLASLGAVVACAMLTRAYATNPDGGPPIPGRSKIEAYLASHDVASLADLRAIDPTPTASLLAVADDARVPALTRARAVSALRWLPSQSVHAFLGRLVQDNAKAKDAGDRLVVRRAAVTLGWLAGSGAADLLALLFDNDDPEVRVDAAIGLGLTRTQDAALALRHRLDAEATPRVRDQIERQLRSLAQALREPAAQPSTPPSKETPESRKTRKPTQRAPMRGGW
jgi:hypothetical protein